MERQTGPIPQIPHIERSKLDIWRENRRLKRLKKDIHRFAKKEGVLVSIFDKSVCGHKQYYREVDKLSQVDPRGNEVCVFTSFNEWDYLQEELRERIKAQGQEVKRLRKAV